MNEYFDRQEVKRFFKFGSVALVLLVVFLGAKTLSALKDLSQPSIANSTIVVTGLGEAFATPDIASFSFSVSADEKTVGTAQDSVTSKTEAIIGALKGLGIEDKDIRTTDYSVYPKYTYEPVFCTVSYCPGGKQVPDGYTVTHSISVKVRNTDDAGKALSLAGAKGATNISSLNFTIDDPDAVTSEARDEAVADARAKAKTLAKSLGVRLGRVVDFSDNSYTPGPYTMYRTEAAGMGGSVDAKAPSIPTGENKVTSNVTITYEIR